MAHLIWERLKEDELEEFILHGGETSYKELIRKVTWAWEKVHVKDNKLKRKDTSSEESYTPWVKEIVCLIKPPFVIDPTYVPDTPDPIIVSIKEVDRLKDIIVRLEQDKERLENSPYDATYEKNQISYEHGHKDKQVLENMEELQAEKIKIKKTLGGLFSVGVNFENLNGRLKEAQDEGQRWKRAWELDIWEQHERESIMLPLNWMRIYQELLNFREHVHLQNQDHELLTVQAAQLEGEIQHLRDLSPAAQVIDQEQGGRA
ncbi:hypothetical protein KIW84_045476 [Lathyrus oleraceus]|uniref:DUF7745 domain-containing protein n=1 Tax=Pisum sativum TaxID=3888 RepID=A0A9D4XJ49_PEA|nr:hypothetical protein KIW84_045476 [Pisum sativum]